MATELEFAYNGDDLATGHSRVCIGGLPIDRLTRSEFAALMVSDCRRNESAGRTLRPKLFFSVNGNVISRAARDPYYRSLLDCADYLDADGMPLVYASRWLTNRPVPERVATTDFVHDAARAAAATGVGFYLLGATEEVNARAALVLAQTYPGLKICGRHHGYFGPEDEPRILDDIRHSGAGVLWVGLGVGRQEAFSVRVRDCLPGIGWIKTCGGLFDFVSGKVRRAPDWMQKACLEWAFRTALEPRRLFMRYMSTNGHALWLMLTRSGPAA